MSKISFVAQGKNNIITARLGGVPVINIEEEGARHEAIMAVNFLRSGCPQVQLVITNGPDAPSTRESLAKIMLDLQLPREKFYLFGKPSNEKGGQTVLTFSDKNAKA